MTHWILISLQLASAMPLSTPGLYGVQVEAVMGYPNAAACNQAIGADVVAFKDDVSEHRYLCVPDTGWAGGTMTPR
jgi:hypothetical protein